MHYTLVVATVCCVPDFFQHVIVAAFSISLGRCDGAVTEDDLQSFLGATSLKPVTPERVTQPMETKIGHSTDLSHGPIE